MPHAKPSTPARSGAAPRPASEAASGAAAPRKASAAARAKPAAAPEPKPAAKPVSRQPLVVARADGAAAAASAAAALAKAKHKLVRDSFTIPKSEYAVLDALKLRAARLQRPTKKSEVLRAGIAALHAMSDKAFLNAINGVPSLKTGRPKATTPTARADK